MKTDSINNTTKIPIQMKTKKSKQISGRFTSAAIIGEYQNIIKENPRLLAPLPNQCLLCGIEIRKGSICVHCDVDETEKSTEDGLEPIDSFIERSVFADSYDEDSNEERIHKNEQYLSRETILDAAHKDHDPSKESE